jgi:hypothetical protein
MARATMAIALLVAVTLVGGCSGADPLTASGQPTDGAAVTSAAPDPVETSTPLDGLSAQEVWKKATGDAAEAESVHVIAKLLDGSERVAINLKLDSTGHATGTVGLNGDKIAVRRLGKILYFKADRTFWITNADLATANVLANKWIMVKKGFSKDMEQFFELTDLDFIVRDALTLTADEKKALTLKPGIDIAGQPTVGLTDEGSTKNTQKQTLYISATDPALPMTFTLGNGKSQSMKFRGWNKGFTVVAPYGAIDLAAAS